MNDRPYGPPNPYARIGKPTVEDIVRATAFGGRDHSTVYHAVNTIERLQIEDDELADTVMTVRHFANVMAQNRVSKRMAHYGIDQRQEP